MALISLEELARLVPTGSSVGIGRLPPLALVRALIRAGVRDLDLVTAPTGGMAEDLLIAAGAVRSLQTSGVDLGEHGAAPNFARAAEEGSVAIIDSSCPATLMALQAGASGVSFAPVPGLTGSDLVAERRDWKLIDDPYREGRQVVLVPAITPAFALVHCLRADGEGNLVTTVEFDDRLLIAASGRVLATVEEVTDGPTGSLRHDEQLIPGAFVEAIALVPGGSLPIGCFGRYPDDSKAIGEYVKAAANPATMRDYVDRLFR